MHPRFVIYMQILIVSAFLLSYVTIRPATAINVADMINIDLQSRPQRQAKPNFVLEQFYRGTDSAAKEFGSARSDHAAIALDIGRCYQDEIGDPIHWSPSIRAILLFELDEHLMHSLSYPDGKGGDGASAQKLPSLNPFHAAAISFSDRISRDRLEIRRELEDSRSRSTIYQSLILIFGAFATVFVSIRSMMKDSTKLSSSIGILAIVFSAAGTALSSMNAFDGSQSIAVRDQRTLSQLQQLHWRVASDVLTKPELCKDHMVIPAEAMEMVASWRSRLETIRDNAVETIARPGDLSPGKASNAAAPEKGGQTAAVADR